jgi:hypothetical protein
VWSLHRAARHGVLLVSLVLGRFGFAAIAVLFLVATLAIAAIGLPGLSYVSVTFLVMLSAFSTLAPS